MRLFSEDLLQLAQRTIGDLRAAASRAVTAESCTGGLIAGLLTEISGASDVVGRGFVVYSNEAKHDLLGVPKDILDAHGAVSAETVRAMAEGALAASAGDADIAVAVSGIAGPGGGSPQKPVGTVYIGVARRGADTVARHHLFSGDRTDIRLLTVHAALELVRSRLSA